MSQPSTQGIQTLLEAEKEAAKTVAKARQYRIQRLKDAKSDAVKEINELKSKKEKEFEELVKKLSSTEDSNKIDQDTELKLAEVKQAFLKNKEEVIQKLIDTVCRVEPSIHPNLKISQ